MQNLSENDLGCTFGLIQSLNLTSKMPQCANRTQSTNAVANATNYLIKGMQDPDAFGCPLPCLFSYYTFQIVYQHINAFELFTGKSPPQNEYILYFYFNTLETEVKTESLIIDLSSLIANIGGNLGLFLGFSCLSIFILTIELIQKKIK
jgi:hypothetical protein